FAIKKWSTHPDLILSTLCKNLLNRKLYKCKLQTVPFKQEIIDETKEKISLQFGISKEDAAYFVFTGDAVNTTYQAGDEHINILFKDRSVKDISRVDNPLIHQTLSMAVKKFYICQLV